MMTQFLILFRHCNNKLYLSASCQILTRKYRGVIRLEWVCSMFEVYVHPLTFIAKWKSGKRVLNLFFLMELTVAFAYEQTQWYTVKIRVYKSRLERSERHLPKSREKVGFSVYFCITVDQYTLPTYWLMILKAFICSNTCPETWWLVELLSCFHAQQNIII